MVAGDARRRCDQIRVWLRRTVLCGRRRRIRNTVQSVGRLNRSRAGNRRLRTCGPESSHLCWGLFHNRSSRRRAYRLDAPVGAFNDRVHVCGIRRRPAAIWLIRAPFGAQRALAVGPPADLLGRRDGRGGYGIHGLASSPLSQAEPLFFVLACSWAMAIVFRMHPIRFADHSPRQTTSGVFSKQ
jgi:hypothetical protein